MYCYACKVKAVSGHSKASAKGCRKRWWFNLFSRVESPGTGRKGASRRGRMGGGGELRKNKGGVAVKGVGGSTGCPECRVVSIGKSQRGREWGRIP